MNNRLLLQLPDLNDYKQQFINEGVTLPLPTVSFLATGLLAELPPPPLGKTGWPWSVETEPLPVVMPNGSEWPKISIVMPSYNQGQFIEETIRSVLLQNYPNLEFIICDGGSSDETKNILEEYSPWLSFWQSKGDRGQGHAINLGFSLSSGNYYGWINSDDFYLPNCLHNVATHAVNHFTDFIYGDTLILYNSKYQISYWYGNIVLDRYLRFGGLVASHASFWKSSIHQPIWEKMNCNVDGELWIRLLPDKIKRHLKIALGVCRIQPQSKTVSDSYHHLWKEDDEAIASIYGNPPQIRSYLAYEFVFVQRLYRLLSKLLTRQSLRQIIRNCAWLNQFIEGIEN